MLGSSALGLLPLELASSRLRRDEGEQEGSGLESQWIQPLVSALALTPAFQVHEDWLVSQEVPWSEARWRSLLSKTHTSVIIKTYWKCFQYSQAADMPVYFKQPQRDPERGNGRAGEEAASRRRPRWERANVELLDEISEQESNIFILQRLWKLF